MSVAQADGVMLGAGRLYGEIARLFRGHRRAWWQVSLLSAVLNVLMLGGSFFMLLVYDEVLPSRSIPTLIGLLVMIVTVYAFQGAIDLVRGRAAIQLGAMLDERLSDRIFQLLARHELRLGRQSEGMQPIRDLDQVRFYLSGPGPLATLDLPWTLLFLGILYLFHVALGLVATAGVLILVVLTWITARLTRAPTEEAAAVASARYAFAEASRRNAEVLVALGMEGRARRRWAAVSHRSLAAQDRLAGIGNGMQSATKMFRLLLQSLVLATGAALVISGKASGGVIIASSILSARALAPVEQVIASWRGLVAAGEAWSRLERLMLRLPEDRPAMPLPAPKATLQVEGLSAGPPGIERISVADMSFQLTAGDVLGVIGPSGSGKTSLLRALVAVWTPRGGAVRLDGASLGHWPADAIGAHLGYLPQDIQLFDGTVAQNIARFEDDADAAAILAAAHAADVHELVSRLPGGYDAALGPSGGSLSAGQRQRVALARALYRDPFLIALDEPNANLDRDGEAALKRAVAAAAARGAIVVVATHNAAAVSMTNKLLYMTDGRLRMIGPRDEVLAQLGQARSAS